MNKFERIISDYDFNRPVILSPEDYYTDNKDNETKMKVQRLSKGTRCETTETE